MPALCHLTRLVSHSDTTLAIRACADRDSALRGRYFVCPICVDSRKIDASTLIEGAELNGTIPMWNWIGDDGATTFSY